MSWDSSKSPARSRTRHLRPHRLTGRSCAAVTLSTPIQQRFSQLQQQGRCALMPFLMAGDAELTITGATLLAPFVNLRLQGQGQV